MARTKPKNNILTREQAESAMTRLSTLDMKFAEMDLAEAKEISAIREAHAERQRQAGRPLAEAEKALLLKELKSWAEKDCSSWKYKGLDLALGKLGFRLGMPTVVLYKTIAKTMAVALELLSERLPKYVRETPTIDKEKILAADRDDTLDLEKLKKCGLKVSQKDEFWVETEAAKELEKAAKALKNA